MFAPVKNKDQPSFKKLNYTNFTEALKLSISLGVLDSNQSLFLPQSNSIR